MKISLHYNGSVCVELFPEAKIEAEYIAVMLESAEKGRTVTLTQSPDGGMVVTVPK